MDAFIERRKRPHRKPRAHRHAGGARAFVELKGQPLFARASGLGFLAALGASYPRSTVVAVPIFFLLRPILNLLKKVKWFTALPAMVEEYFRKKAEEVKNRKGKLSESGIKQLGVFIFIAIPLPMTGVWTGTAIAVFLGLKFKEIILPVLGGNLVAGLIISLLAELFLPYVDIILYVLFALVVVMLIVFIVKIALTKPKEENKEQDEDKKE